MPLKERKPFKRLKPPHDLKPNEDLFYLKATHEVFRNYDDFFERVITINSLVWSCSISGKSNLTFQEAIASEEAARHSLKTFSLGLRKPILYLATLTDRKRLNDMCDDVFLYVKDRFFVGEEVEATINGVKKSCEVTQVILPDQKSKSPSKADSGKAKKPKDIPPSKVKYEVVNYSTGKTTVVKAESLSRPKGTFTKPRNKLFLKHHTQPKEGKWVIKESVLQKEQLDEFQFSEVFCGPLPEYVIANEKKQAAAKAALLRKSMGESSGKKTVQGKLNFRKESAEDKKRNLEKQTAGEKQRIAAMKEREKKELLKKQKLEEEKAKQMQDKINERLKKREEKKKMVEMLNNWKKPRDDLECDDLKELPPTVPVDCGVSQTCFGDALMVLEFLNTFEKQIQVKDSFPQGFNFELVEKALTESDIQGVFNDLLQLFLSAVFRFMDSDDTVERRVKPFAGIENLDMDGASDLALTMSTWPQKYHGTALRDIPMDSFSITEILRLHILSSGARSRNTWQGRVTEIEDSVLDFVMEETDLLKKLEKNNVFELNPEERCKILTLLVHQLLSFDDLRILVDENADKTRPLRNQLKQMRWAFTRKGKEGTSSTKKDKDGKTEGTVEGPSEEVTENTDNMSPEEKSKDLEKQKTEFARKEKEIEAQIRKLQYSFNIVPLGRDRAFRRYWVFQTVPGVFVEDDDPFKGSCLAKPTVQNSAPHLAHMRSEATANNIKKYLQSMDAKSGSSDKENDILRDIAIVQSDLPFPLKNRKLSDLNPRVDSKKGAFDSSACEKEVCALCVNNQKEKQDNSIWYCPHSKNHLPVDQCSANIDTCPVHNINAPRAKWSFYYRPEDIDTLILGLNDRGFRERSLKASLLTEKERIADLLSRFQFNTFNKTLPLTLQPEVRKSQRHQSSQRSSYADMLPAVALDVTLRDMIVELEHRIFHGGLGSLKVENREEWRTAIDQGAFQSQMNIVKKEDDDQSNSETPKSSRASEDKVIKDLAFAMLQLSEGIESKYLNPPLGETDESKKKQKQAPPEDSDSQKKKSSSKLSQTALERWQESLLQCTSLSQLFVHLGTLERSVAWSRSVLKAHCRICRRRGDAENMLLCDSCNRGHHVYCLKPPLSSIPEGDWFCQTCKPPEKSESPKKKARTAESDSDNEMETSGDEEEEDEEEEEASEAQESDEEGSANGVQESCEACGDVGTLLCCDNCPLMYHAECVNLKRIPRGEWLCPKCAKKSDAMKKAQKHPASGSYGTRSAALTAEPKKRPNPLRNKLTTRVSKRKRDDSSDNEAEHQPPPKRSNRERKSIPNESEKEDNPFKKVYRDSAQNRRRSKTGSGGDMLDYKACIDLLVELMRHPSSWPFLVPVSKKDAPDYHQIIKHPMDFGTIRSKLNYMNYKSNEDFIRDIYLVLQNCEWFNPKSSPEYKAAQDLHKEVKRLLQEYQLCNHPTLNTLIHGVNGS